MVLYQPADDQPQVIKAFVKGFQEVDFTGGYKGEVRFASVMQALNKPILVITQNKTLAIQWTENSRKSSLIIDNELKWFVS